MFSRRATCLLFLTCTKCVHFLTSPCYEPSGTARLQLGDRIAAWYSHALYPTTPPTPMLRPCTAAYTNHLVRPHFQDFAIALTGSAMYASTCHKSLFWFSRLSFNGPMFVIPNTNRMNLVPFVFRYKNARFSRNLELGGTWLVAEILNLAFSPNIGGPRRGKY